MVVLTRMKQILEINLPDRFALVQPGVVNVHLTQALKGSGYHYAPDPSSQGACTIGGNVATNSGGPHTLKYGVTVNHVLGVEAVLSDGSIIQCGGPVEDPTGLDLAGTLVGSEGTLAVYRSGVAYATDRGGASRYWPLSDLYSVLRLDRFRLEVVAYEGGSGETRPYVFELKTEMPEGAFRALWEGVNGTRHRPY